MCVRLLHRMRVRLRNGYKGALHAKSPYTHMHKAVTKRIEAKKLISHRRKSDYSHVGNKKVFKSDLMIASVLFTVDSLKDIPTDMLFNPSNLDLPWDSTQWDDLLDEGELS